MVPCQRRNAQKKTTGGKTLEKNVGEKEFRVRRKLDVRVPKTGSFTKGGKLGCAPKSGGEERKARVEVRERSLKTAEKTTKDVNPRREGGEGRQGDYVTEVKGGVMWCSEGGRGVQYKNGSKTLRKGATAFWKKGVKEVKVGKRVLGQVQHVEEQEGET